MTKSPIYVCVCVCVITRPNAPLYSAYYNRSGLPRIRVHQLQNRGGFVHPFVRTGRVRVANGGGLTVWRAWGSCYPLIAHKGPEISVRPWQFTHRRGGPGISGNH